MYNIQTEADELGFSENRAICSETLMPNYRIKTSA